MGSRGPIPKRSSQRAGHRAKDDVPDQVSAAGKIRVPSAVSTWDPQAKRWYLALKRSGQARYFEPSDWEYARLLADLLTRELHLEAVAHTLAGDVVVKLGPRAMMMKAILAGMTELGTTEGSRRRMRIEVDREPEAPADDVAVSLEAYRQRTRASGE